MVVSHRFKPIVECSLEGRSEQVVVAVLDGTLLIFWSAFPCYLLVVLEAESVLRATLLLLSVPGAAVYRASH